MKQHNILIRGIPASPGIKIGRALVLDHGSINFDHYQLTGEEEIAQQIDALKRAFEESKKQLSEARASVDRKKIPEARNIIDTHLLILKDKILQKNAIKRIRSDRIDAAWALKATMQELKRTVASIEDDYMQQRTSDIDYIETRILNNLAGKAPNPIAKLRDRVVIAATDLSPADTANLNTRQVMAFITESGGKTSHTAIMARALKIPAVAGLKGVLARISSGDTIVVDGVHGVVIINPDAETLRKYEQKKAQYEEFERQLLTYRGLVSESTDGFSMRLCANIEIVEELSSVAEYGADGIGLFRTEFLYMNTPQLPSEEELFDIFRTVAQAAAPNPVTIRTLDIGGDKIGPQTSVEEKNPALGLRAIRYCLRERDLFRTQLRAILRASAFGKIKIMFPMICCVDEVRQAKAMLRAVQDELHAAGIAHDPQIEIGIMVEVPSSATIADLLAREVHFFSIGTNDLIQYLLAIDRVNEQVSYLYEPLHPAVLWLLRRIIQAAHANGIPVAMCGEMAGEPVYIPILLGLGIDELSMNPMAILEARKTLRALEYTRCRAFTEQLYTFATADEVKEFLLRENEKLFANLA